MVKVELIIKRTSGLSSRITKVVEVEKGANDRETKKNSRIAVL